MVQRRTARIGSERAVGRPNGKRREPVERAANLELSPEAMRAMGEAALRAFRENLDEKLRLARWLYEKFRREPEVECLGEPDLSVVAYRFLPKTGDPNEFNRRLLKTVNRSGKLFLSSTTLRGTFVLRACVLSFRTHQAEVEEIFETVTSAARRLSRD